MPGIIVARHALEHIFKFINSFYKHKPNKTHYHPKWSITAKNRPSALLAKHI